MVVITIGVVAVISVVVNVGMGSRTLRFCNVNNILNVYISALQFRGVCFCMPVHIKLKSFLVQISAKIKV